jgi:DNA-binding response OmpR family regulator
MSKIQIVDDDEQLGRSIARLLQREGHECTFAQDIRTAIAQADGSIDLVVIELQPAWLGLVGEYRARLAENGTVPFLITTGRRELFRSLGQLLGAADDLLTKPFDAEELLARIEIALRRSTDSSRAQSSAA